MPKTCPACGHTHIRREPTKGAQSWHCQHCGHNWEDTECPNCPAEGEWYRFFHYVWDIEKARQIIADKPRSPVYLTREQAATLGIQMTPDSGRLSITSAINETHLAHIPEEKLSEPVLFVAFYQSGRPSASGKVTHLLADGTHRATILFRQGRQAIPAYVLTLQESLECMVHGRETIEAAIKAEKRKPKRARRQITR